LQGGRFLASPPDRGLFDRYATEFGLDSALYHADMEEMLLTTKPQAVLVYSSTFDHPKIVELCTKRHIAVMMEKPLAISLQDAQAIDRASSVHQALTALLYRTWPQQQASSRARR
jgi:predicted dehydrogenase